MMGTLAIMIDELLADETGHASALALLILTCLPMAVYGAIAGRPAGFRQMMASALKFPMLPLITLLICGPVLLCFSRLLEFPLSIAQVCVLLLEVLALNALVVLSFGPIALFFGFGSRYDFMKLLHTVILGLGGIIAMARLMLAVYKAGGGSGLVLYAVWIIVFAFVGCQVAWAFRPFIGSPDLRFEWFRRRSDGENFYSALADSLRLLLNSSSSGGAAAEGGRGES